MNKYTLRIAVAGLCGLAMTSCVSLRGPEPMSSENHSEVSISRIVFGSCNNPRKDAVGMYPAILEEKTGCLCILRRQYLWRHRGHEPFQEKIR